MKLIPDLLISVLMKNNLIALLVHANCMLPSPAHLSPPLSLSLSLPLSPSIHSHLSNLRCACVSVQVKTAVEGLITSERERVGN